MIFKKLIKFAILELAINKLFQELYKNFKICKIDKNQIKVGDKFPKIEFYYGNNIFTHHNCEILQIHDKSGYVTIKYEYVSDNLNKLDKIEMNTISSLRLDNLRFIKYENDII